MKLAPIICLAFIVFASATPARKFEKSFLPGDENRRNARNYLLVEKEKGHYTIEDLKNSKIEFQATADDVTLYFYSKSNPEDPVVFKVDGIDTLAASPNFDKSRPNVFIAHGWNNDYTSNVFSIVRPAILENHNVNIFSIDWQKPANSNYLTAKNAVPVVGEAVGEFVNQMIAKFNYSASDFILAGHSLGAHVAGKIGATVNGQVNTIVGLDPASPLFSMDNLDERLDTTDGSFVHIIHTCGGLLGFLSPIGHSDYYPNGGQSQPGCGLDLAGTCAHSRSYQFFAESIRSGNFVSRECTSITDYNKGKCETNGKSEMGGFDVDKTVSGSYYLDTNSEEPFAKGE